MTDRIEQLERLTKLKEQGALTQKQLDHEVKRLLTENASESIFKSTASEGTDLGLYNGLELSSSKERYRLIKQIGEGGMGQLWQVEDINTSQLLKETSYKAIKVLPIDLAHSKLHLDLLRKEAALTSQLSHPNIINAYGLRESDQGIPFILMDYLKGQDIDNVLANKGTMKWQEVEQWLKQIAEALDYAWQEHQLIHRDLKPGNLFITEEGRLKVLDFGLAWRIRKSQLSLSQQDVDDNGSRGTVSYMPPEAFANTAPDPRQDVYALSCICYQMLTGETPYPPEAAHHRNPSLFPEVPIELNEKAWAVLKQGLAYKKEQRPNSAVELVQQLQEAQLHKIIKETPPFQEQNNLEKKVKSSETTKAQIKQDTKGKKKSIWVWALIVLVFIIVAGRGGCTTTPSKRQTNTDEIKAFYDSVDATDERRRKPKQLITKSKQQDLTIQSLLTKAKKDISALRLSNPKGNNALDKYQNILQLDANNRQAQQGVINIIKKYLQLAEEAKLRKKYHKAKIYLNKARKIQPKNIDIEQAEYNLKIARQNFQKQEIKQTVSGKNTQQELKNSKDNWFNDFVEKNY